MRRSYVIRERPLVPQDYDVPVGWWGWNWEPPVPMSVSELLAAGNLDARTAALCWMVLEAHGSLLIAAEQPHSGKTTTVTSFLDFLPNETRRVFVRGWAETFDFVGQTDPRRTLLLVNELSSHLPVYLWGRKAVKTFRTLRSGYALVGTLHADSAEEAIEQLTDELGIERADLSLVDLLLVMRVYRLARGPGAGAPATAGSKPGAPLSEMAGVDERGLYSQGTYAPLARRVVSMHRLQPGPAGVRALPLVSWDQRRDEHTHDEAAELELLCHRRGPGGDVTVERLRDELDRRTAHLGDLVRRGVREIPAVRKALATYRGENVPTSVRGDPTDG